MRRRRPAALISDTRGSAAAELTLVTPFLVVLMFGSFELGNYFLNQHVLAKAVRDGARFAARYAFSEYSGCSISSAAATQIRRVTRTGQIADPSAAGRIANWDAADEPATITIIVACNSSGDYTGIYVNNGDAAATVTVGATVAYTPLLGSFGLDASSLSMNASSQAAVTGTGA